MVKIFLYPLSWLYGLAIAIRNRAYDLGILKSKEFNVPVISIGNITVGGTGKTPHVEYLTNLLKEKYEVATLSRGYKRKTKGFRLVENNSTVAEVGDEPLQIKKKNTDVTVAVCENRVIGVEKLLKTDNEKSPDVVLLDDAFQHRRITPGINILLIDYNRQLKYDHLLPVGRMRERAHQSHRANIIIFTKCPEVVTPIMQRILQNDVNLLPYQALYFTRLKYGKLTPVFDAPELTDSFYEEQKHGALVVTGIASPEIMLKHVKKLSRKIESLPFPDHYAFTNQDIESINTKFNAFSADKKIIITTEKDAMRFRDIENISDEIKKVLYYLPVCVEFLEEGKNSFNKKILNYVGENKSNRALYKRKNKSNS
jgi:tetraacyldisaccharide 4'-kinase